MQYVCEVCSIPKDKEEMKYFTGKSRHGVICINCFKDKAAKSACTKRRTKQVCKYCGTKDNLYVTKDGRRLPVCVEHYTKYAKKLSDNQLLGRRKHVIGDSNNREYICFKCGLVGTIDEMSINYRGNVSSTCKDCRKKQKRRTAKKKIDNKVCKYCGTKENLVITTQNHKLPVCAEHYFLFKKEIETKKGNTVFGKHGVRHVFQSDKIKKLRETTLLDKFGVAYVPQTKEAYAKMKRTNRKNHWNVYNLLLGNKKIIPLFTKDEYINAADDYIFKFKCNRCGKYFSTKEGTAQRIRCGCLKFRSSYEDEIVDWLHSIGIEEIEKNKRFPKEIDVYIPKFNLGIDFHGLYWHSEVHVAKDYHREKYLFFVEKGIDFIQIFESDWVNNIDKVKSIIKTRLGMNKKLYGRKCKIVSINDSVAHYFMENNHLQQYVSANINIGLVYDQELVALMTFSKPRFDKKYKYELIRFATKKGYTVVGGFTKILKHFIKIYGASLISYIDVRYFNGHGYLDNGFICDRLTQPNYYYFKGKSIVLESRYKFQKHKLQGLLPTFDPTRTEHENMLNNGYRRIYDAGHLKMIYNK